MKHQLSLALFSAIVLVAASRPMLAAAPEADARSKAVVAALQAVSPDSLGGRFGLAVATVRSNERAPSRGATALQAANDTDHRAYAAWKRSSK